MVRSCRKATMLAHSGAIWMVLSIAASLALLSSSSCLPIDPGAAQLPAPTNVGSAVQYAVLTARQNSSECLAVDGAVLRGLLVHVAFDGTLGFPGEGPPKRYVCPLSSAVLTDKGPSRSKTRCRQCPGCSKRDANVPCDKWKHGSVRVLLLLVRVRLTDDAAAPPPGHHRARTLSVSGAVGRAA